MIVFGNNIRGITHYALYKSTYLLTYLLIQSIMYHS